jgi:hypothetical protein
MKCVFISHSSKDANVAKALCHALEELGVRCWMAPRDITPGVPWSGQIAEAIREAAVFVLVFSQHSNKSDEVLNELGVANKHDIPILPLRIENIEPTGGIEYYVGVRHWLDALTSPLQEHVVKLKEAVVKIMALQSDEPLPAAAAPASSAPAEAVHGRSPAPRKAWVYPAWIVGAALLAIAGIYVLFVSMFQDGPPSADHRGAVAYLRAEGSQGSSEEAPRRAPRKAFVVGVNEYRRMGTGDLKNAVNDALLVRQTLEKCGFTVEYLANATVPQIKHQLDYFSKRLQPGDDAVFYFSGQGYEPGRDMFLLASDYTGRSRQDLFNNGLHLNTVLQALTPNEDGLKLVILDCCRIDPFKHGYGDDPAQPAPAAPSLPEVRSLAIMNAAGPGKEAYDGIGGNPNNSPFTQALCEAVLQPGWTLEEVFNAAAKATVRDTQGMQRPEMSSNLMAPLRLVP